MAESPSLAIRLFGTEEAVPETPVLTAGPLSCSLEAGNLRHIRLGGAEAIRAIQFIVRDRNWGTYTPIIENLDIRQEPHRFSVTYDALCADHTQRFGYRAHIEGHADGRLTFAATGRAETDFLTNRTGFVVLHGVEGIAGAPVEVLHVDGTVERSRFPELIDPMCPFMDIRALTHEVLPGVRVTCRMEGDTFEMEDQRNWTDASYKTYVRPLALPWPYTIPAGTVLSQQVELTCSGRLVPAMAPATGAHPIEVTIGGKSGRTMPPVGLAVRAEHAESALAVADLVRAARPAHLVCHFDARAGHGSAEMRRFGALGERVGAPLVLEAVMPCLDEAGRPSADPAILRRDLTRIRDAAAEAGVRFERVAVSPACDLKCTLPGGVWPPAPSWAELFAAAREAFPDVPVGGGMFAYFTELNRKRPPAEALAFVCHTTCPLVHAGDDLSLMEGLESLPSVFASTRAFAGGKPYWLFPTAIAMRLNPYGAAPTENPDNVRQAMNRVDPRERAVSGAAWYVGYAAHAAHAGVDALTLAAATGPSGIVYTRQDWVQPWFDGAGAKVFPSWHALRGLAALVGRPLREATGSRPRDVTALAAETHSGAVVWLANLTGEDRAITLRGLGSEAGCRRIDADRFETICRDPPAFEADVQVCDPTRLRLAPYAVVRIEARA